MVLGGVGWDGFLFSVVRWVGICGMVVCDGVR